MTNFKPRLEAYVKLIEKALPAYLPSGDTPQKRVEDAMSYSLLSGGKRIRGVLVLAFYRLFCDDVRPALPFAVAMEMMHAYSLIHDDLPCMDDSGLRRGKPSCHVAFDEATALLAGDGLLTLAFETIAQPANLELIGADKVLDAIRILAHRSGTDGMIGGQMMDLLYENKKMTDEQLQLMDSKKTGALITASVEIGCALGGAGEETTKKAVIYSQKLGLAFQIMDDILDCTGDEKLLGKPVHEDVKNQKSNYITLHGIEKCKHIVDRLNRQAKHELTSTGLDVEFLCSLADMLSSRQF